MKRKIGKYLGVFFLIFAFFLVQSPVFAAKTSKRIVVGAKLKKYKPPTRRQCDIKVPKQYTTIQAGIDAASPGNTVCAGKGTYNENVFINKSIRLSGKGARKSTINGPTQYERTANITASNVIVEGFTIIGAGPDYANAAVHLAETVSGTTIRYNRLVAGYGGLAFLTDNAQHNNLIRNNILVGNNSPYVARVGQFDSNKPSDKVDFLNNTFIGTVSPISRQDTGITLDAGAPNSLIKQNVFNTSGTMLTLIASNSTGIINENNFNSSTTRKVSSTWGAPLNAENNWWGDTDPSDNTQGSVDYTPFALSPFRENKIPKNY